MERNILPVTELGAKEVCEQTGATYRQVDYWARIGFLGDGEWRTGYGSRRRFNDRHVEVVRALVAFSPLVGPARPEHTERLAAHVREHGLHGKVELVPAVFIDLDQLNRGTAEQAPPTAPVSACKHPKAERKVFGWGTRCGACGEVVKP